MDWILIIIILFIPLIAEIKVKSAYGKYMKVANNANLSGVEVARRILDNHNFEMDDIIEWTGYSYNTIINYLYKFKDLLEEAKKTFYHITLKVKKELIAGRQYVYLFKFYERNEGIISKVGMTTQLPMIRLKQEIKDTDFDRFVVDAPCSGSGTFRRAPDAKFRLTPEKI